MLAGILTGVHPVFEGQRRLPDHTAKLCIRLVNRCVRVIHYSGFAPSGLTRRPPNTCFSARAVSSFTNSCSPPRRLTLDVFLPRSTPSPWSRRTTSQYSGDSGSSSDSFLFGTHPLQSRHFPCKSLILRETM